MLFARGVTQYTIALNLMLMLKVVVMFLIGIILGLVREPHPYKTYCYYPLYKSLPHILQRKGYIDLCESWRNRTVTPFGRSS